MSETTQNNEGFTLGDFAVWITVKEEAEQTVRDLAINEAQAKIALAKLANPELKMSRVFEITGHRNLFGEPIEAARESTEKLAKWALGGASG